MFDACGTVRDLGVAVMLEFRLMVKIKLALEQAMEAQRKVRCIVPLFL